MTRPNDPLDELLAVLTKEKAPQPQQPQQPQRVVRTLRKDPPPPAPPKQPEPVKIPEVGISGNSQAKDGPCNMPNPQLEDQPLFSEKHPQAVKASRILLPRIGPLVLVLWLTYWVMSNLIQGDYWFAYRWFHDNELLQAFIRTVSSKSELQLWFSQYGAFVMMVAFVVLMTAFVFHRFAWRFWFKDYIRFTEGVETTEGRAFWIEGWGFWFNLWDAWYGRRVEKIAVQKYVDAWVSRAKETSASWKQINRVRQSAYNKAMKRLEERHLYHPEKRQVTIYLKSRRWPPIPNPINPGRSLWKCKLTAGSAEKIEKRGPYELIVHEGKYRRIVGVRAFATHNEPYTSAEIPTSQASRIFKLRVKQLIGDTNELSKANPKVRLDKLRSGTVLIDPEIMEMIKHEREEKAGTRSNL